MLIFDPVFLIMTLSQGELHRYNRHLILKEFGLSKQSKLKNSKVLVVGAGGLGSPALLYLTAAGVGTVGIVDFDSVEYSNLQRQIIFREEDCGKNKAVCAADALRRLNQHVAFQVFPCRLTSDNALSVITQFDVVLDGTDNFATRYLINDACVLLNKPLVYASILRFEGQLAVFNFNRDGQFTANYRDLFPIPPDPESVPNCEQAGVLGVLPGIIGSMQASEVIKIITGIGEPLTHRLLLFNALTMEQTIIGYQDKHSRNSIEKLIDYDEFCTRSNSNSTSNLNKIIMKEVTVQELKAMIDSGADFQLIDVREPHEFDICNLGGELIPQAEIPHNADKVSQDKKVVIHCRSGARSGNMVQWLEKNKGMDNLYNLKGGILAWAREIDTSMHTY